MITSLFKDKVQLAIFWGLMLSGVCLVFGLFTSYTGGVGLATYLGSFLGTIALVLYIIKLFWAFVKDTAQEFWSDLCLVNMGLTLSGAGFVLAETKETLPIILASAGMVGACLSWVFYKSGAAHSRVGLLIVHILLPILLYVGYLTWDSVPATYYRPNGAEAVLAIATTLISIPIIMNAVSTPSPPRLENNAMGT